MVRFPMNRMSFRARPAVHRVERLQHIVGWFAIGDGNFETGIQVARRRSAS